MKHEKTDRQTMENNENVSEPLSTLVNNEIAGNNNTVMKIVE